MSELSEIDDSLCGIRNEIQELYAVSSTRRERAACLAMQGILASEPASFTVSNALLVARDAVLYADALIAELDKAVKP